MSKLPKSTNGISKRRMEAFRRDGREDLSVLFFVNFSKLTDFEVSPQANDATAFQLAHCSAVSSIRSVS